MSIASEITRLQGVKANILQAIADKGVTVPADSSLDDCPALIASIPTGTPAIPDTYKRVMYIELTGANSGAYSQYHSQTIFKDGDMGGLNSIDTLEMDVFIPNTQGVTDGNYIYFWKSYGPWRDAAGKCRVSKDTVFVEYQAYIELQNTGLDNAGKFLSIKRSARAVQPGESAPSGYNHFGQLTVNGLLTERNQYDNLQSINQFAQYMTIFSDSTGQDSAVIAATVPGTKVFRIETKYYATGKTRHNLIPCIRASDSRPGFYEPTYDRFVTSYNSGTWAAGPVV